MARKSLSVDSKQSVRVPRAEFTSAVDTIRAVFHQEASLFPVDKCPDVERFFLTTSRSNASRTYLNCLYNYSILSCLQELLVDLNFLPLSLIQ